MPSEEDLEANLRWLNSAGMELTTKNCYIAPHYPKGGIQDEILLAKIESSRPAYVVINVGGGTQQPLGPHPLPIIGPETPLFTP